MTKFALVRQPYNPSEDDMAKFYTMLTNLLRGFREKDKIGWRRFWGRIGRMEHGEIVDVEFKTIRNAGFHRKFFVLLGVGFDAWDPAGPRKKHRYRGEPIVKNEDQFRKEVTILAGFFEQRYSLDGTMTLDAKSIAFANMEQPEFEDLYSKVADVLLTRVLTKYTAADLDRVVNEILALT